MEDRLDSVEVNHTDWKLIVKEFYDILSKELEIADRDIKKVKLEDEMTDETCELCGKPMVVKHGRYGEFLACSGYPSVEIPWAKVLVKIDVKCPRCRKRYRYEEEQNREDVLRLQRLSGMQSTFLE